MRFFWNDTGRPKSESRGRFFEYLVELRTVSLSRRLALRCSDPRRPVESKSSVARLSAPAGIHELGMSIGKIE